MVQKIVASAQITMTDLSDAIISGTQPTNPKTDQLWIKRVPPNPDQLFRWNGSAWVEQTLDLSKLDPDADGKIENHEITIGNMVDDAKIDITERQEVKNKISPLIGRAVLDTDGSIPSAAQLWTNGVGEVWAVRKAAQNVGIKNTDAVYLAVETAYNALQAYLNAMTPIRPWDASAANKDKIIAVTPIDWRNKWVDYFKSVQNLTTAVQGKLQENLDNVKVGTSNILDYSGNFVDTTNWVLNGASGISIEIIDKDGFKVIKGVGSYMQTANKTKLKPDTEYVYSGEIMFEKDFPIDSSNPLHCWIANGGQSHSVPKKLISKNTTYKANTWERIVISFKTLATGETIFTPIIYTGATMGADRVVSYLKNIQLEEANVPSSWKPSVNDVDRAIKDADDKAQKVTDSVNDMSLDSRLTPVEKIQLKTDYDSITAEFTTTLTSADAFNLTSSSERAGYNTAYNSLKTFVDPLLVKMNETSNIDRTVFRQRFKDYYDTKAKLLKKISDTSKGLIDDAASQTPNILMNSGFMNDSRYWILGANVTVDSVLFEGVKSVKSNQTGLSTPQWRGMNSEFYDCSMGQTVIASIYTMSTNFASLDGGANLEIQCFDKDRARIQGIGGSADIKPTTNNEWKRYTATYKATDPNVRYVRFVSYVRQNGLLYMAKPMMQYGTVLGSWSPNPSDFIISNIDKSAEESKNNITNMSNDNKLTPIEKVQLKKEWAAISAEKPQYEALGNSFKATTELNAYVNAYNVLNNTLNNATNGYLKNMQSTEDINGATFRAQFDDYYDKKSVLIKKVNLIIQGNIDGIQGVKNLLLASKRTVTTTDYLVAPYTLTENFVAGQDYTIVVKGSVAAGQKFGIWQNNGVNKIAELASGFLAGCHYVTFKAIATTAGNERDLRLYNLPQNTTSSTVEWVALYKGTKPFDWSAAPEDADVGKTNLFVDSELKYLTNWIMPDPAKQKIATGIMPNGVRHFEGNISGAGNYIDFTQYIEVEPNTEYTFSMNAGGSFSTYLWEKKADKSNTAVYKDNASNQNGAWDMSAPRSAFTRTIRTQPDTKLIQFIFRVQASGTGNTGGRIALPKLEKGTTASEWTANPFDTSNGEIFIQGSGAEQTDKSRQLVVNGIPIYNENTGRGLRLVTLRKDSLAVVEDITYDVYGSDTPKNDLANKLNSLGDNVFITLSSWDAIGVNVNLVNALMKIGGSGAVIPTSRTPFVLIGMKGLGRYNGLEQYTGIGNIFPPATISSKVVNGAIQGVNNNNGQASTDVRYDLRLTAPLPTSIDLDSNGITAKTTTAGKYARMDYRGLYIAGGAIQIDGGLSEGQLASGVTRKMSYLDSNGLYTGQVNIGGSGTNGILSIKNASNAEIVRGDTTGLTVRNGAITVYRPDGYGLIINGQANFDMNIVPHEPAFMTAGVSTNAYWYATKNTSWSVCNFFTLKHTGRYAVFALSMAVDAGSSSQIKITDNNDNDYYYTVNNKTIADDYYVNVKIDLGVPTGSIKYIYLKMASNSTNHNAYVRILGKWIEG